MSQIFTTLVRPLYVRARRTATSVFFERRYGVRTDEVITLDQLGLEHEERERYGATGWLTLRFVLPRRQVGDRDVFVDFGSGMGRVVLQAALMYPFARVVGVEISEELNDIARANIERNRTRLRCTDVALVHTDVLDYRVPDDVTVAFFYNPFSGEVFRSVMQGLIDSVDRNPRTVRIIYGNPKEEAMLLASGRIRLVRSRAGLRPGKDWSRSNSWRVYELTPGPPRSGGAA